MDLNDLLSSLGLVGLLGYSQEPTASQLANQKIRDIQYDPTGFIPDRPMMERPQMNPSDVSYSNQPFMGFPEQLPVDKMFGYEKLPISLSGGMSSFNQGNVKGIGMGGRLGAELPLDEQVRMQLGVSGGGQDVTYAMGTPYEGRSARYDITGIDATIRDLAKNREFGAEVRKAIGNSLYPSIFFRQRF